MQLTFAKRTKKFANQLAMAAAQILLIAPRPSTPNNPTPPAPPPATKIPLPTPPATRS